MNEVAPSLMPILQEIHLWKNKIYYILTVLNKFSTSLASLSYNTSAVCVALATCDNVEKKINTLLFVPIL